MKLSLNQILVNTVILTTLTACGQVLDNVGITSKDSDPAAATVEQELVDIDVNVSDGGEAGFALAAASKYTISLQGCASGFTSTATEIKSVLNVYKFDRGCLAKLTSLEYSGITYAPSSGSPFTTWQPSDAAIYTNSGNTSQIRVTVTAQLGNPVGTSDTIGYSFTEITAGTDQVFSQNTVGAPKTMIVGGQAAPAFLVKSLSFTGINAQGAGAFGFSMECTTPFVTGTTGLNSTCNDLKLSQLKYALVKDTFGGVLTAAQASAIFATGSTAAVNSITAASAPGANSMANGGFLTATLNGPDAMHTNPNMLLVIEGAGTSYLYFNVDVSTISQNDTLAP